MSDANLIRDALASRLDLTVKPGGLDGLVDGAPMQVVVQLLTPHHHHHHGAVLNLQTGTFQQMAQDPLQLRVAVTLPFPVRLDAKLAVGPAGGFESLRAAGRRGFDQRFVTKGAEADRVDALLTPEARRAMDDAFVGDPGVRVTDAGLTWEWQRQPPYPTVDELEAAIRSLPAAWHAIVQASRSVHPPAGLEEVLVALGALALPPGVELRGSPVGLVGESDGVSLSVTVAPYAAGGWLARSRIALPEPIPGSPKVVREDRFGWFDRLTAAMAGRGEITVGDRAFDQRFAVRSLKPDALKAALSPDVREAMLGLDRLIPVTLSGAALEASGPIKGGKALVDVAEATLALAAAFAARG